MADGSSDPGRWVPVIHAATLGVVAASLVAAAATLSLLNHPVPESINSGIYILIGVVAGMFSVRSGGNGASRNSNGVAGDRPASPSVRAG